MFNLFVRVRYPEETSDIDNNKASNVHMFFNDAVTEDLFAADKDIDTSSPMEGIYIEDPFDNESAVEEEKLQRQIRQLIDNSSVLGPHGKDDRNDIFSREYTPPNGTTSLSIETSTIELMLGMYCSL